jgi:flagellar motility protein MotE (MotC chaperone)
MSKILLTVAALSILSVSKLEEELKLGYPKDILVELMEMENAKTEPRKTAIEILNTYLDSIEAEEKAKLEALEAEEKAKLEALEAEEKAKLEAIEEKISYIVAKGKSVTTLAGIKSDGDKVEEKHFKTKEVFDNLVAKNFIDEVK